MIDRGAASHAPRGSVAALTIAAAGIVYGDIGTSPLYALDQIFLGHGGVPLSHENVLGGISLVIWTITIIVAIKYAIFVLRAENDGEGGVFALYGLLHGYKKRGMMIFLWSLMLGAGLLFGDGVITPAISVLAAVEGLGVAAPRLAGAVIPLTVVLLTALFAVQFKGTSGIGRIFGPILIVWFIVLAVIGLHQIAQYPQILQAFNPFHGLLFLRRVGIYEALLLLGALMLVVTGGEAMYADLGHFGALPIRMSWFGLVYPALLLNYLGQGAFLLGGAPIVGGKIFYSLVPPEMLYPMILLATAATIIASQALISGRLLASRTSNRPRAVPPVECASHASRTRRPDLHSVHQLVPLCRLHHSGHSLWIERLARRRLRTRGFGRDGDYVIGDVSGLEAVLGLARDPERTSLGDSDGNQRIFLPGKFTQVPARRICPLFHRHGGVPGDGNMAVGPQSDIRGILQKEDHDGRRAGPAASKQPLFHGAYRGANGSHACCATSRTTPRRCCNYCGTDTGFCPGT